ncbi:FxsA family protein [Halomonas sp. E19]|uniref:FxsA family protein n=1 Tax=unclassified Halomonas TaxID=2609666 RepID=UPI004034D8C8
MPILILFTLFTLLDFVVLFTVGSYIGLPVTLALLLSTGFVGLHLIRRQGTAALSRAKQRLSQGELPSSELLTGAALIFGGALLLAPGFLSDLLGLACIVPGARRTLGRLLAGAHLRVLVAAAGRGQGPRPGQHEQETNADAEHHQAHDKPRQGRQGDPLEGDFISRDEPRR